MISLNKIKESVANLKDSKGKKKDEVKGYLQPLEIGFKVESRFDIAKRKIRKNLRIWLDELKFGGFFTNFWMWNFFLLNILTSFLLFYTISNYIDKLPDFIGVNYDDGRSYDLLWSKNYLFILPLFHIVVAVFALLIAMKYHKKLSHVFTFACIQFSVLLFFELVGLRDLIFYFL